MVASVELPCDHVSSRGLLEACFDRHQRRFELCGDCNILKCLLLFKFCPSICSSMEHTMAPFPAPCPAHFQRPVLPLFQPCRQALFQDLSGIFSSPSPAPSPAPFSTPLSSPSPASSPAPFSTPLWSPFPALVRALVFAPSEPGCKPLSQPFPSLLFSPLSIPLTAPFPNPPPSPCFQPLSSPLAALASPLQPRRQPLSSALSQPLFTRRWQICALDGDEYVDE